MRCSEDDLFVDATDLATELGFHSVMAMLLHQSDVMFKAGKLPCKFTGRVSHRWNLIARLEHERWIADCPFEGCSGAEYVSLDAPFFCFTCGNQFLAGDGIPVSFPAVEVRQAIYKILHARPILRAVMPSRILSAVQSRPLLMGFDRSWRPGVSLDDLMAANGRIPKIERGAYFDPLPARLEFHPSIGGPN